MHHVHGSEPKMLLPKMHLGISRKEKRQGGSYNRKGTKESIYLNFEVCIRYPLEVKFASENLRTLFPNVARKVHE